VHPPVGRLHKELKQRLTPSREIFPIKEKFDFFKNFQKQNHSKIPTESESVLFVFQKKQYPQKHSLYLTIFNFYPN